MEKCFDKNIFLFYFMLKRFNFSLYNNWNLFLDEKSSERNLTEEVVDEVQENRLPLLSGLGKHFFVQKSPVLVEEVVGDFVWGNNYVNDDERSKG